MTFITNKTIIINLDDSSSLDIDLSGLVAKTSNTLDAQVFAGDQGVFISSGNSEPSTESTGVIEDAVFIPAGASVFITLNEKDTKIVATPEDEYFGFVTINIGTFRG